MKVELRQRVDLECEEIERILTREICLRMGCNPEEVSIRWNNGQLTSCEAIIVRPFG